MARISGDISDTELVHFSTIPNCYRVWVNPELSHKNSGWLLIGRGLYTVMPKPFGELLQARWQLHGNMRSRSGWRRKVTFSAQHSATLRRLAEILSMWIVREVISFLLHRQSSGRGHVSWWGNFLLYGINIFARKPRTRVTVTAWLNTIHTIQVWWLVAICHFVWIWFGKYTVLSWNLINFLYRDPPPRNRYQVERDLYLGYRVGNTWSSVMSPVSYPH